MITPNPTPQDHRAPTPQGATSPTSPTVHPSDTHPSPSVPAQPTRSATLIAMGLVMSLFFLWGLTITLLNALNAPFQEYLNLSTAQSTLLQVAYFGAYFVMAIPSAWIAKRHGYRAGILAGLALFALGALLTIPATGSSNYGMFLLAMFVLASGATALEVNANPYMTKLGDESRESLRLNIAQSVNGVGSVIGPIIAGAALPSVASGAASPAQREAVRDAVMANIGLIYGVLAGILIAVLVLFLVVRLPEPPPLEDSTGRAAHVDGSYGAVLRIPHFSAGIVTLFLFNGAQVGGMALFATYALTQWEGLTPSGAASLLALLTALFALGRILTTPLMARIEASKIFTVYVILGAAGALAAFMELGKTSVWIFLVSYFFVSIGFPTIFSLALKGLHGDAAKTGSSLLIMSVAGAGAIPFLMGAIADSVGLRWSFALIALTYLVAAWYAAAGHRLGRTAPATTKD